MNVELAEERVLVLRDRFTPGHAQACAWAARLEAFGTLAKLGGLLSRPRDEDFELVYRERRLQPFWRIVCAADYAYERRRDYLVQVAPEVTQVVVLGETRTISNSQFGLSGLESCREEIRREFLHDGLTKALDPALAPYLKFEAEVADEAALSAFADDGVIVVPPQAKASMLVREALPAVMAKFDADRILEETVRIETVDLYYRPVHAFRYRWQGKEAVVEFDALTGEARPGGTTFEQHLGKILEPAFLIDVTVETVNLVFPGARLIERVATKGFEMAKAAQTPARKSALKPPLA